MPDKKRNTPLITVQFSGRSQGIGQYSLYQCIGMSGTLALHVFCNQASKLCYKKIGHEPSGGQIVMTQEIRVFIMLSCQQVISVDQIVLRHIFFSNSIF